MKQTQEQKDALKYLRKIIKPGDTIHTVVKHVSKSGMMRVISFYIPTTQQRTEYDAKGAPRVVNRKSIACIDYWIKRAIGYTFHRDHGGLKVNGCGMDMGFAVVYELGAAMWPNGTSKPHSTRNGEPDTAGGYAIKHQWL